MFGIFKKKSSADYLAKNIKNKISEINRIKGGCIEVCVNFTNTVTSNDLFKSIGFIQSSELNYDKTTSMYSALILLASIKSQKIKDPDGFLIQLAETTFVLSNIVIDEDGLKDLLLDAPSIIKKRDELLEKSRSAWIEWTNSSIDVLKTATMM